MTGVSDRNRSETQGEVREDQPKEGRSKGTTVGARTGEEAEMRAMSVRGSAKSDRHRKTHLVEPDGTGRESMHLTRGDLGGRSPREVSSGHSSEEGLGNEAGAKGQRTTKERSVSELWRSGRIERRSTRGVATAATTPGGGACVRGWNPAQVRAGLRKSRSRRKEAQADAQ